MLAVVVEPRSEAVLMLPILIKFIKAYNIYCRGLVDTQRLQPKSELE